jgi:hypothetical protein
VNFGTKGLGGGNPDIIPTGGVVEEGGEEGRCLCEGLFLFVLMVFLAIWW